MTNFRELRLETVRKGVRGNAPSMDLSGIRTIERAQRSLLASRRPTSRAYPRLFGRSQKRNSRKFAITSNAQATAKLRGFGDTPPSPASPLWGTNSQNIYRCTVHIYEEHVKSARSLKLLSPAAPASEAGREVATCRY